MNEIDYGAVLADLRARRDKLDVAIAAIEQMVTGGNSVPAAKPVGTNGESPAVEPALPPNSPSSVRVDSDTFFRMGATEATRKYLGMAKKPTSLAVICRALRDGGHLTSAKNFYSNLYTTLSRSDDFTQVGKNWALAEWYPGRRAETKQKAASSEPAPAEPESDGEID